ncbi:hypothetical protein PIB30_027206 [Stylosanthes scabra]|uniref:Uncharacterized protein n=1 Tax=Stylosanthes scabra TaxID=79078 RepID=A0ABU6TBC1_9FABA|nr:hypothetical protein [Stylosanthes scabra]
MHINAFVLDQEKRVWCSCASSLLGFQSIFFVTRLNMLGSLSPVCILINDGGELNYHTSVIGVVTYLLRTTTCCFFLLSEIWSWRRFCFPSLAVVYEYDHLIMCY